MNLIVLDKNFDIVGPVSSFTSLLWTRRYYEPGAFELYCLPEYFSVLDAGEYLYRSDRSELGVISSVIYEVKTDGTRLSCCKGLFAESLLDRRVIELPFNKYAAPEVISRELVRLYAIEPSDSARAMPHIVLGELKELGSKVQKQITGDRLGSACFDIEKTQELSHRLRYDHLANNLIFEVYQGLDRRQSQDKNTWAVFSSSFCNVKTARYERNSADWANVAYVAGEDSGSDRKVVEVDISKEGDQRREIYVDARDLQSADDAGNTLYTEDEYRSLLYQRGLEKLSEHELIESVDSEIDPYANLVYLKDFDLGDLVTFRHPEFGIEVDKRITEVREVLEGAAMQLDITFGQDGINSLKKLIKQEVG